MREPIVLASRTGGALELTPAGPVDHGGVRHWMVHVRGEGLDARVHCSDADWLPEDLTSFFARLAEKSDRFGEEVWDSEELRLVISHPKANTMLVQATLALHAPPLWTVETQIEMDPGAFGQAAELIRHASDVSF
ncbi:MAG TPA: DUF6228 family protein [Actinomycetota bacterium]